MDVFQLLIPQLLAAAVVLVIALRTLSRASRTDPKLEAERAARQAAFERHLAEMDLAAANPGEPASKYVTAWRKDYETEDDEDETPESAELQLTLHVADVERVNVAQVTKLIASVSDFEKASGGTGFVLADSRAEPGRIVLTLTPSSIAGAAERVKKVAGMVNAAFLVGRSSDLGPLPAGVSAAVAAETLAA